MKDFAVKLRYFHLGNTFQARVRRGVYRTNALTKTFSSRVDAKKWIRDIEAKLDRTNIIVKEVENFPTLSSLMKRYLNKKIGHELLK